MTKRFYGYFSFLVFLSITINVLTLREGHNWAGDFSQYIIGARNLLNHRHYTDGVLLGGPNIVYPPGFSFILLALIKFFGLQFRILKIPNVICWYGYVVCLFPILRKRLEKEIVYPFLAFLCLSSHFFFMKQSVISDMPFLGVITAAFLFFERYEGNQSGGLRPKADASLVWFFILAFFSILIRSAGLILFMACFVYFGFIKRQRTLFLWSLLILLVATLILKSFTGLHPGNFSFVGHAPLTHIRKIFASFLLPLRSLVWVACPDATKLTAVAYRLLDCLATVTGPVLYVMIFVHFFRKLKRRNISLWGCFASLYFLALVFWSPFDERPDTASRFLLPLLAPAFILAAEGTSFIVRRFLASGFVRLSAKGAVLFGLMILMLLNIVNIGWRLDFNDDVLFKKHNQELFSFVRQNIGPQEYYIFWRPRPMALMTGRLGTAGPGLPFDKKVWKKYAFSKGVSYFILDKKWEGPAVRELLVQPDFTFLAWENERYAVFRIKVIYLPPEQMREFVDREKG